MPGGSPLYLASLGFEVGFDVHIPIPSLLLRLAKHGSAFKGGLILRQQNSALVLLQIWSGRKSMCFSLPSPNIPMYFLKVLLITYSKKSHRIVR